MPDAVVDGAGPGAAVAGGPPAVLGGGFHDTGIRDIGVRGQHIGVASLRAVQGRHQAASALLTESAGPTLGLHLDDVTVACGNLVDLVGRKSAAYQHH
jgi:hypothetical protein